MVAEPGPDARRIYAQALAVPEDARMAYLNQACGADVLLRAEVEVMLLSGQTGSPGDAGAESETRPPAERARAAGAAHERPGTVIGRYKILQLIGEGGFGSVFMAEQEQPVRRRVALKVIKLGMDTRQVVARFEAERQALALMDHPHIAKVFDGGVTDSGRPFFVMELVHGVPITAYCDGQQLSTRERAELFAQVCSAVQHAHTKGVVHRDIKPSNILVRKGDDGRPVPKVIDFGIAKATGGRLTEKTLFTEFSQFIGTPEYMSPEQAGLRGADVDTRSDIYSLGVLLYELLTGVTPFDGAELRSKAYAEVQRIIQEVEPPRPSTRLSAAAADTLSFVAARRKTEAAKLGRSLRGDLDWIVMQCLEKDRSRRYETANSLAADVHRYLAGKPITARPPSSTYRLQKFVRRHRAGVTVAASGVVAVMLLAGTVTYGTIRESRQRERYIDDLKAEQERTVEQRRHADDQRRVALDRQAQAEDARAEADAARQFLQDMLTAADPYAGKNKDRLVRDVLDEAARKLDLGSLAQRPKVEAAVRLTLGKMYSTLGLFRQAESHLARCTEVRRQQFGERHPEVAASLNENAVVLAAKGDYAEAERLFQEALEMNRSLLGRHHLATAKTLHEFAALRRAKGAYPAAEALLRESLQTRLELLGEENLDVADGMNDLGSLLGAMGKYQEGEKLCRRALDLRRSLLGNEHPDVATSLHDLAMVLSAKGDEAQADDLSRQSLEMRRKLLGEVNPAVAAALHNRANVLRDTGELGKAEELYREALDTLRRIYGEENAEVAAALQNLANLMRDKGDLGEAERLFRKGLEIHRRVLSDQHPDVAAAKNNLAGVLQSTGKLVEAESLYRQALETNRKLLGESHRDVAAILQNLALLQQQKGDRGGAEELFRQSLAAARTTFGNENEFVAGILNNMASLFEGDGNDTEAEKMYLEVLAMRRKVLGEDHRSTGETSDRLASLYLQRRDRRRAAPLRMASLRSELRRLEKLLAEKPGELQLQWGLGTTLARLGRVAEGVPLCEDALGRAGHRPGPYPWFQLACLHLFAGNENGYRNDCQQLLRQITRYRDPAMGERVAKACLLAATPEGDMESLKALVDRATGSGGPHVHYFYLTRGLFEYRSARYEEAVTWAQRCRDGIAANEREWEAGPPQAASGLLIAMARHQLGQRAAARESLDEARLVMKSKLPQPGSEDLAIATLENWLVCQILSREADELLRPSGGTDPAAD